MIRKVTVILFVLSSTFLNAQNDSTTLLSHEIGFNTVSLIKQVISNSPGNTLAQLPYDVFYNLYYKDLVGLRLGVGFSNSHTETPISGQIVPRTSDLTLIDARVGLSYNFMRTKRLTFNGFGDFIFEKYSNQTAATATIQSFPNPGQTVTTKSLDKLDGIGGEIGVGIKYNFNRHLSIYAELPVVFKIEKTSSSSTTTQIGIVNEPTSYGKSRAANIIIPTTIYLVLRF